MARFLELTVAAIRKTTRDAVEVTLHTADGQPLDFKPGQYLAVQAVIDGERVRRTYSICSTPSEGEVRLGIKRVNGGKFSTWANDGMAVGDVLESFPPMGAFTADLAPDSAPRRLAFAAGSGITPILSILRSSLEAQREVRWTLVYINSSVSTAMFREELEDLKNRFMGRLSVLHILSQAPEIGDVFSGRVTPDKLDELFRLAIRPAHFDEAFVCGPEPVMDMVCDSLGSHGFDADRIRIERFGKPRGPAREATTDKAQSAATKATIILDGTAHHFDLEPGQSILEGAIAQDLDPPFACKAGVCSTCRCKVVEGQVEMRANHALQDDEVADGYVLSCQAIAQTPTVKVEYET